MSPTKSTERSDRPPRCAAARWYDMDSSSSECTSATNLDVEPVFEPAECWSAAGVGADGERAEGSEPIMECIGCRQLAYRIHRLTESDRETREERDRSWQTELCVWKDVVRKQQRELDSIRARDRVLRAFGSAQHRSALQCYIKHVCQQGRSDLWQEYIEASGLISPDPNQIPLSILEGFPAWVERTFKATSDSLRTRPYSSENRVEERTGDTSTDMSGHRNDRSYVP